MDSGPKYDSHISTRVESTTVRRINEMSVTYGVPKSKLYRVFIKASAARIEQGGADEFVNVMQDSRELDNALEITA